VAPALSFRHELTLSWREWRMRGFKPLVNFETVVNLIGGTRTSTGLNVKAILDTNNMNRYRDI
jgi:hypothetical protein